MAHGVTEHQFSQAGGLHALPGDSQAPQKMTITSDHALATPIPDPSVGEDEADNGFWARRARQCPWKKGRNLAKKPGTLLYLLKQLPTLREPTLRETMERSGERFDNVVGAMRSNIEALLAQAVGIKTAPGRECLSCQQGNGYFVSCVTVPSLFNKMPCCANCHWRKKGGCVFPSEGQTTPDSDQADETALTAEDEASVQFNEAAIADLLLEFSRNKLDTDEATASPHRDREHALSTLDKAIEKAVRGIQEENQKIDDCLTQIEKSQTEANECRLRREKFKEEIRSLQRKRDALMVDILGSS